MSDTFTCPSCGWPQGPTHSGIVHYDGVPTCNECGLSLAAPQGEEKCTCDDVLSPNWTPDWKCPVHDAKEGEEDGRGTDISPRIYSCGGDVGNVETVTPDIAGLVERLRTVPWDTECHPDSIVFRLCHEAADALERMAKDLAELRRFNPWSAKQQAELTAAKAEIEAGDRITAKLADEVKRCESEIDRLRAALEKIRVARKDEFDQILDIARAALTGRGE